MDFDDMINNEEIKDELLRDFKLQLIDRKLLFKVMFVLVKDAKNNEVSLSKEDIVEEVKQLGEKSTVKEIEECMFFLDEYYLIKIDTTLIDNNKYQFIYSSKKIDLMKQILEDFLKTNPDESLSTLLSMIKG